MSEMQTPLNLDAKHRGVCISDTAIYVYKIYQCLNCRHPFNWMQDIGVYMYILHPDIGVSEFQSPLYIWIQTILLSEIHTPVCLVSQHRDVWISDTPISRYKIYWCLKCRHPYIWMQNIGVSAIQTLQFLDTKYTVAWNSDTAISGCQI